MKFLFINFTALNKVKNDKVLIIKLASIFLNRYSKY